MSNTVDPMLTMVKNALRITGNAYDAELTALIDSAKLDLNIVGVDTLNLDALSKMAIVTYCRMRFGSPSDYDKLKASYDEQKAQMMTATGYGLE